MWPPSRIFSYHAETIGDDHMDAVAHEAPATPLLAFRFRRSKRDLGLLAGGEMAAPYEAMEPPISACCGLA